MLIYLCLHVTPGWAAAPYAGRSLDEVLRELAHAGGFQLVYNTEVIPAGSKVAREPHDASPPNLINELLEPFGLRLRAVDAHTFAIVPQDRAPGVWRRLFMATRQPNR